MPVSHLLLVICVVVIWGTNFVVMKWGIADFPPFVFATLRFFFTVFPCIFFMRRPSVSWKALASFGMFIGAGVFGLMSLAMQSDVAPGLASLLVQVHVFFTIVAARILFKERVTAVQTFALVLGFLGIAVVAWHVAAGSGATVTAKGFAMCLVAALFWGAANIIARRSGTASGVAFVVWSSLFALPPLVLLSVVVHGWTASVDSIMKASPYGWACVAYQSAANSLFGFGAWSWLLARHSAAIVTPWSLLVPIIGLATSAWLINEPLQSWKLLAAILVVGGLALNAAAARRKSAYIRKPA